MMLMAAGADVPLTPPQFSFSSGGRSPMSGSVPRLYTIGAIPAMLIVYNALTLRKTSLQKVFGRTRTPALGGDVTSVKRVAPRPNTSKTFPSRH